MNQQNSQKCPICMNWLLGDQLLAEDKNKWTCHYACINNIEEEEEYPDVQIISEKIIEREIIDIE